MSRYVAECPNCGACRVVRPSPRRHLRCDECNSRTQTRRCERVLNEDQKIVSRDDRDTSDTRGKAA